MRQRTLIGTIGRLGLAALPGLFAALSSTLSTQGAVLAQLNNQPTFTSEETTRTVEEHTREETTPWFWNIDDPVGH